MKKNGSAEDNRVGNSSKNTLKKVPKVRILSPEAVNEQMKKFIAPLIRQLEELTRPVQGMLTTPHIRAITLRLVTLPLLVQPYISPTKSLSYLELNRADSET